MFLKKSSEKASFLILKQIKDVEACLITFESFMKAATTEGTVTETLSALADGVAQAENTADQSLRRMIDSLLTESYLPSTKEDLIAISTSCDKVANKCESVAKSIVFRRFRFPAEYAEDVMQILKITREQFQILEESVRMLFEKLGTLIKDHAILDRIRSLESQVDVIEEKLYREIYATELDLAHQDQIALVLENICDLSDIIENIADTIQIMLITRKV
ncbi:MAG: DUF47 family protein [Ruminococcaceae bacterium]|nr:DUF47 family protein [Oscillospiraceae bacterium]